MKAYKATYNGRCRDKTYKEGETYIHDGELIMCLMGFHFCFELKNVFNYYNPEPNIKVMEIEVLGDVVTIEDKSVTNKFKVIRFIPNSELIDHFKIDEKNNLIYVKYPSGHERWLSYNEKGRLVRHKDSCGREEILEYDENQNVVHYSIIYFKPSFGKNYEYWQTFDKRNNVTYFKDNSGYECWKQYDENGRPTHYKNSNGVEYCYKD